MDYNFGIDDGAESKFGTHKELIVLNIIENKYCVNKSRDMSRDHFVPFCTPKSICQVLKSPLALDI